MVFYTENDIIAAIHLNYCAVLSADTYRFNIWVSKKKTFSFEYFKV